MNFKSNQTEIDVLELFVNSKNPTEKGTVSKFEEAFVLNFSIDVKMNRVIKEILMKKNVPAFKTAYGSSYIPDRAGRESVEKFFLYDVLSVDKLYDKYTIFSKKENFYRANFTPVVVLELKSNKEGVTEPNIIEMLVIDESKFDAIVKLSKYLNEYFEVKITLSNIKVEEEDKLLKSEEFEKLKNQKSKYYESKDTFFLIEDVNSKIVPEDEFKKFRYYVSSDF